jgi:hypothetical protein
MSSVQFVVVVILSLILGWVSTGGKKSQFVRLVDVFIIGPVCMYAGWITKSSHTGTSIMLTIIGAATISYNLKNWIHHAQYSKV